MFKLYALTALVFFAVDLLWLGVVAKGFYQEHLGHLMRPDVIWGAALLFYSIFIAGVLSQCYLDWKPSHLGTR
jgi:uncharacterized membrane protein|tara:strand:- start:177 stop:395 length:219 start_codon:yes stop_codon:yes gene_type:complete